MSISPELSADLVAYLHGELPAERAAQVASAIATDDTVAREYALLERVLGVVRAETSLEPTAEETESLNVALADALRGARIVPHPAWRRAFDATVHRYRTSSGFRRTALGSIAVHAAAAAVVAWLVISPDGPIRRVRITHELARTLPELVEPKPLDDSEIVLPDERVSELDRPFVEADVENGVGLPPILRPTAETAGTDVVYLNSRMTFRLLLDRDVAVDRLRDRLDDLADAAAQSVENGLGWLRTRQGDDGRWGEGASRDAVTGAVVLAFVQSGHGARSGDDAGALSRAVPHLERLLRDDVTEDDPATVPTQALALRALTWQWALDFRHLAPADRAARRDLLRTAGERLTAIQTASGGFSVSGAPTERPDGSATLYAAAALADLRMAGVLRTDATLARVADFVATLRGADGLLRDDVTTTASALAFAPELRLGDDVEAGLDAVAAAMSRSTGDSDPVLDWNGMTALLRHDRDVVPQMRALLARQDAQGRFAGSASSSVGDDLATALGVLSVTRAMLP